MSAADLKDINYKRYLNTAFKVLTDLKIVGLLFLLGFTFYAIGYDTFFRPSMDELSKRDEAIKKQREVLEQRKGLQNQYKIWDQELKNLDVQMVPIPPGESAKLITVTESATLLGIAQGKDRDEKVTPALPPPHDVRTSVELIPGLTTPMDLMQPDGAAAAGSAPGPAPSNDGAMVRPGGVGEVTAAPTSVPVQRFDFDMRLAGTYPAVIDFVNQLITYSKAIRINKVELVKVPDPEEPDAKDFPTYPVKVQMNMSLSMYLYDAPAATP